MGTLFWLKSKNNLPSLELDLNCAYRVVEINNQNGFHDLSPSD